MEDIQVYKMPLDLGKIQFKVGSVSILHSLVITSTVALSHRKPSSTGTSNYSCIAQDIAKRNTVFRAQ
jgi:hypothetical protein